MNEMIIRVAKVLEDNFIVINKGSNDGISETMKFIVFEKGEEIIDPDTKKSLGNIEMVKDKFKIHHIQEKMTTLIKDADTNFPSINISKLLGQHPLMFVEEVKEGDFVKITNRK